MVATLSTPKIVSASTSSVYGAGDGAVDPALPGTWRVLSARLFYDAGGGGSVRTDGPDLTLWAIFQAEPPLVGAPGMVDMKFGRR
jgi:hypothetical protein